MSARPAIFKEADVKRAVKGFTSAGLRVGRVEIDNSGKIVIIPAMAGAPAGAANEWDEVLR